MRRLFLIISVFATLALMKLLYMPAPRVSQNWDMLQPMETGRSEIAAALLGDEVYIAGGIGFFRTLSSCEIYNIPKDRWTRCPDLPLPIHHVAMASDGNNVYAAGGYSELNFGLYQDAKLWKLGPDNWEVEADLPEPIGEHSMVAHAGAIYLFGGRGADGDSAAMRKYDLRAKSWSNAPPLPIARHSFASFMVGNELWVTGGRNAAQGTRIARTDIYSFETDSWRQGPDMPTGRGGHAAAHLDGQVHIIGGEVFSPTVLVDAHNVFDINSETWSEGPLMPAPRHGMVAVTYQDQILVFGGGAKPAFQTIFSASPSVQRYRPE